MPDTPPAAPRRGLLVRRDDHQVAITGMIWRAHYCALISGVTAAPNGLTLEYAGGISLFADGHQPVLQDGGFVFIDVMGEEVPEIGVVLLRHDGHTEDPPWRQLDATFHR